MLPGPVLVSEPDRLHRTDPWCSHPTKGGGRIIENPPAEPIVAPTGHPGRLRGMEHVGGVIDRLDIRMTEFEEDVDRPGSARGVVGLGVLQMPLDRLLEAGTDPARLLLVGSGLSVPPRGATRSPRAHGSFQEGQSLEVLPGA